MWLVHKLLYFAREKSSAHACFPASGVNLPLGTLSTGQIYDANVTPLPKKTGNENVVGHVTCKY